MSSTAEESIDLASDHLKKFDVNEVGVIFIAVLSSFHFLNYKLKKLTTEEL